MNGQGEDQLRPYEITYKINVARQQGVATIELNAGQYSPHKIKLQRKGGKTESG